MSEELKAKLREILELKFYMTDYNDADYEDAYTEAIAQIGQTYTDAGYKSGREWYKDFARELSKQGFANTGNAAHDISAWVDEAAKRAAGME